MPRSSSQKKNKKVKKYSGSLTSEKTFPDNLKKDRFIYVNGVINTSSHGIYNISLENGLTCLATARKIDTFYRVSLVPGDNVTCEIDPLGLEPNNPRVRGRIVWRIKM